MPTAQLQGERGREREREGAGGAPGGLSLAVPPGPLRFEALLAQVGALGGGQQLQLGLCCLPVLFVALGLASDPIFTLAPPPHCHPGGLAPNASGREAPANASAAGRVADPSCGGFAPPDFNHCLKDWDYSGLPVLTTNAIGQVRRRGGARVREGLSASSAGPHTAPSLSYPQWDLVCDLGWQVILEQILFVLGFASGYLFLGYPADR